MRRLQLCGAIFLVGFGVAATACSSDSGGSADSPPETLKTARQALVETIETPNVSGAVSTVAGTGVRGSADAADASLGTFNDPAGIATARNGTQLAYVADWGNNSVRVIKPDGSLGTFVKGRGNLLNNPRAEAPTFGASGIPEWTSVSGDWKPLSRGALCSNSICGNAYDGTYWFWGGAVNQTEARQVVTDLTAYATDISAGRQKFHFSALLRGNSADAARIVVNYLNSHGGIVSIFDTGEVTNSTWTPVVDERLAPATTVSIRVRLMTRALSGSSADAYFDALQLRAMRPVGAPSSDTDRDLVGPTAVAVAGNGDVYIGGNGIGIANQAGTTFSKVVASGAYVPPKRVSSIAITSDGYAYFADPTSPLLHVRTPSGVGYYANIDGDGNGEPLAIGALSAGVKTRIWATFRGYSPIYIYECPKLNPQTGLGPGSAAICTYQSRVGGSAGFADDLDGVIGGERFRTVNGLALGANDDLLVAEEGNSAVRRHYSPFTRTLGGGTRGFLDGAANVAQFNSPTAVTLAPNGRDVWIADRLNNAIRSIKCGAASVCGNVAGCSSFSIDDEVPCTTDTCEVLGIRHTPKATGASCADGDACNGAETCSSTGVCQPGTPPTLDDNQACTADACDPVAGVVHHILPAGTTCFTGTPCAPFAKCSGVSGACPAGPALDLDDLNACTTDACGATGVTHTPKAAGTACPGGTCDASGGCIPSNVASLNPLPVDRTVLTPTSQLWDDLLASNGGGQGSGSTTACVRDATHPTCVFEPTHMALVRGTVKSASGAALAGATVSVVNHPEFGTVQTLANGEFFLVVNGGGPLTIRATKTGLLKGDREVNPTWGATEVTPDIALIPVDATVTSVALGATGGAFASGSKTLASNGDGGAERQASVYFPSDVKALANGVPVTSAKFRVTEYTSGANGKARMPADVAESTMYTYAAEFTLEDAAGTVYENVSFVDKATGLIAKPVFAYLTNFLALAVTDTVPVGYYNRQTGRWEPMDSGQVISIHATTGAVTCNGGACNPAVTPEESQKLSAFMGKTLWRLPLTHFSPLDFNLGLGAPDCEGDVCPAAPEGEASGGDDTPSGGSCKAAGSIIEVERQVLRESFPVVGTPFSLNYSSENTLGYGWNKVLGVDLRNQPFHSKRRGFVIDFKVAGKRVVEGSPPTDKPYQIAWDGRDQAGRSVQGSVMATLDVGAVFAAVPRGATRFSNGRGQAVIDPSLVGSRANPEIILWKRNYKRLQVWDASALGFGGWTLSSHHAFDPEGNVIYLGDGTHRNISQTGAIMSHVAGKSAAEGYSPDGTAAAAAVFGQIDSLAVTRGGEVFLATPRDNVVRKVNIVNGQYGTVSDYAGQRDGTANFADPDLSPKPARGGYLRDPKAIALHPDGRLVILDRVALRIFEVSADGSTIRTIAGRGNGVEAPAANCGSFADNTLAVPTAQNPAGGIDVCGPSAIATGPDGSVYYVDGGPAAWDYVVKIDASGYATVVAGDPSGNNSIPQTGCAGCYFDTTVPAGTDARQIRILYAGIAVDRNNTLWLDTDDHLVSVPPNGQIRAYRIPGQALLIDGTTDLGILPSGELLRSNTGPYGILRCSTAGACTAIAGAGNDVAQALTKDGDAAMRTRFDRPDAVAGGPDGSAFVAYYNAAGFNPGHAIFRVMQPSNTTTDPQCKHRIPSHDGAEYYCFDEKGRHLSTRHALTGGFIRRFCYNADCSNTSGSLLLKVVEADNRETTIDRSVAGFVTITSPTGQVTKITLDTAKVYADRIDGDGGIDVQHGPSGLLTALTDVNVQPHAFAYDKFGRLERDSDAGGGYKLLNRVEDSSSKYTVSTATRLGKLRGNAWQMLSDGTEQRNIKLLSGLENIGTTDPAGKRTTTFADKTVVSSTYGPDPRFGMAAPYVTATSFSVPAVEGAPSFSTTTLRTLGGDGKSLTEVTNVTGLGLPTRTTTTSYVDNTKQVTVTTPANRVYTYTLDTLGRVVSFQAPGVPTTSYTINATTGLLTRVARGTGRIVDLAYSTTGTNKGFLTSISDPHPSSVTTPITTSLVPDANGRALSQTRNSVPALLTQFAWTNDGQLKTLIPPNQPAHQLIYDTRGDLKTYIPPTLGGTDEKTSYTRDVDRFLQSIDAPGVDDISLVTSALTGQLSRIRLGNRYEVALGYYGAGAGCLAGCAPGKISTVTDVHSSTTATLKWLGMLRSSVEQAGSTVSWTFNNNVWVTKETLARTGHASPVTFDYDLDGLLTCASLGTCADGQTERLTVGRDPASGRIKTLTLGATLTETFDHNAYGELKLQDSTPYRIDYEDATNPRDALARVKRRIERVGAAASETTDYTYDDKGRLWKLSGAATSEYRYDDNGNRTYAKNTEGVVDGASGNLVYDAQDRLTKYGLVTFEYTPKGDVSTKTTPTGTFRYDYDAAGGLRFVELPGGSTIDYVIDGFGRRIGKKVNGELKKQWVYGSGLAPIAELDGAGAVTMRFVFGSKPNTPDFIKVYATNKLYRVFSDQLGTPRAIYDVTAGTVFKPRFDEFGIKLGDNTPFEIPFGFAGGLYDPDTKLTRFGARDYDASIGRWVSKDPILFGGQDGNLYAYVGNDPINFLDPFGLKRWSDAEVRDLLNRYGSWLDGNRSPYGLMERLHRGGGDFDFWAVAPDDTFELCGVPTMNSAQFGNFIAGYAAGHMDDTLAYMLVRGAGAAYGIAGALFGYGELGPLRNLGDTEDSVTHINVGWSFGNSTR